MQSAFKPHVSVIIPTYNNARYIGQTVDSVLKQTYDSYEVIVIDDGSTDDTRQVLQPYGDRIRYIYQDNHGVSAARNHGLHVAKGDFIAFVDGDDIVLPTKLAEQAALLDKQPKLGCVHSGWHLINEHGEVTGTNEPWHKAPRLDSGAWLTWKPVFLGAMLIRRDWLDRVGGFDTSLRQAEDVDLMFRLALTGCRTTWLYKPTVCYRQHGGNTVKHGLRQAEDLTRVLDKAFGRPNLPRRIRRMENKVRYYSLMWIVWHLYCTGYASETTLYLRRSLAYSNLPAMFALQNWLSKLARWCIEEDMEVDRLQVFWPCFKAALQVDDLHWQEIEQSLNWWLDVWWYYLIRQHERATQGLRRYRDLTVRQLVGLAQFSIVVSPIPTTNEEITQFWEDAGTNGMLSPSNQHEVAALYLAVFGRSVLMKHWLAALKAFGKALRHGFRPRATGVWYRFVRSALVYFLGRPERSSPGRSRQECNTSSLR